MLALFGQFSFMVIERVVYLNRSFKLKCCMQMAILFLSLHVVHDTTGGELHNQEV